MATIKIIARDSSSAMEEVSKKLGTDAYILSTTSKEGGVEIEATNDPMELKKFSESAKKTFSGIIQKELGNVAAFPIKKRHESIKSLERLNPPESANDLSDLSKNIRKLTDELRGMYITNSSGLSVDLGESTSVKLQRYGFDNHVIKALYPSFNGLSFERGRIAFMKALSGALTFTESAFVEKRVTFVAGLSGVGKTTLTAKLAANQMDRFGEQIVLATLGYEEDAAVESLRSHARMLNMPVLKLNPDTLMETLCSTKSRLIIDVCLDATDTVDLILRSKDFLDDSEVACIVAISGGANKTFIRSQAGLFRKLEPNIILTKLDECDITSTEISEFFLNEIKICYLTGSKSILGDLSHCTSEILAQYLIENC